MTPWLKGRRIKGEELDPSHRALEGPSLPYLTDPVDQALGLISWSLYPREDRHSPMNGIKLGKKWW